MRSEIFSASMMIAALRLPVTFLGMIEASTTRLAGEQPADAQDPAADEPDLGGQGVLVTGGELDVDAGVVLEVATHGGDVGDDVDAVTAEVVGVPDAGEHEQLR
jgi:hypothetical protein